MLTRRALLVSLHSLAFLAAAGPARAQWVTQTIPLQPGWNAVYLEVQPSPADPASVFAGLPVESVWAWNPRVTTVQFIQDPTTLVPDQPEWLRHFPAGSPHAAVGNLFAVHGGQAYLVKLGGAAPATLTVRGIPVVRPRQWLADSFNLVGFPVDPTAPPTFQAFLGPSAQHSHLMVFRLDEAGQWQPVLSPASETIRSGQAYWVHCRGVSAYQGPISVALEQADGIHFGRVLAEQTLRIANHTAASRTVTVRPLASQTALDPGVPAVAGDVPLSRWQAGAFEWRVLAGDHGLGVAAGKEAALRLSVRRTDMAPYAGPAGPAGALYQSILRITDGRGTRLLVPVSAQGLEAVGASGASPLAAARAAAAPDAPSHPRAGLWVGTARLNKVNQPSSESIPDVPQQTSSDMDIRLILHVDGAGQARLLQQAYLLWREGTRDAEGRALEEGRYVIATSDDPVLLAQFTGSTMRGGRPAGRRVSTAAFGFRDPVAVTGDLDSAMTCDVVMGHDDPVNPFKHRYHPDHDNLGRDFRTALPPGRESYGFTRRITLTATAVDPAGASLAGWGDREVGGVYREAITGVHRDTLHVEGIYRLRRVSEVPLLDDGL